MKPAEDFSQNIDEAARFLKSYHSTIIGTEDINVKQFGNQTVMTYRMKNSPEVRFLNFGMADRSQISPGVWRRLRIHRSGSSYYLYNPSNFFSALTAQKMTMPIHIPMVSYKQRARTFWESTLLANIELVNHGSILKTTEQGITACLDEELAWSYQNKSIDLVELEWFKSLTEPPEGTDYITIHFTKPTEVVHRRKSRKSWSTISEQKAAKSTYIPIVVYKLPNDPTWYAQGLTNSCRFLVDGDSQIQARENLRRFLEEVVYNYYYPMFADYPHNTNGTYLNKLFRDLKKPPLGADWIALDAPTVEPLY